MHRRFRNDLDGPESHRVRGCHYNLDLKESPMVHVFKVWFPARGITERIMEPWIGRRVEESQITRVPPCHFPVVSVHLTSQCEAYHCHEECMYHVLQYKISWYTTMHCLVLFKVGSGRRVFFTQTPRHVNFKYPQNSLFWTKLPTPHLCDREKEKKQIAKGLKKHCILERSQRLKHFQQRFLYSPRGIEMYAMGTGDQRLLMVKLMISVTVVAPPWDNVPQCSSCSHHLLVVTSSLTFVCYLFMEVIHFKAKVRLSYIIPWTIQNTPPWCTGLPQAWRWRVSPPQPKSSESRGQSQPFLHTGWLLQGLL